jgi:hypothetical protein
MTLETFLKDYCCTCTTSNDGNNIRIHSKAIRRSDDMMVDEIGTVLPVSETSMWVSDSKEMNPFNPITKEQIIDFAKRGQLNWFAMRAPIDDYFPLNSETDISMMYCSNND